MQFRNDIQGLRALAVVLVFIFHLNPRWLPGGFIGVDVFFVISGYLISSIILHKKDNSNFTFLNFYKGRIKRIVPAYYFMISIIGIASLLIYFNKDIGSILRRELVATSLFFSNMYFTSLSTYFGASMQENIFLHTWTLGVEMQFYLILPLVLIFIRNNKVLFYTLLTLTVLLFSYYSYNIVYSNGKSDAYFSLFARMPEFLVGILFAMGNRRRGFFSMKKGFYLSLLGLVLILLSAFILSENSLFPAYSSIPACLGTAFILSSKDNKIANVFSSRLLVYIGTLSYSIYLWHWPIMALFRYFYFTPVFSPLQIICIGILTFLCSYLSYTFIENSFVNKNDKDFILHMIPVSLVLPILFLGGIKLNMKLINIPLEYSAPSFGLESHNKDIIQTFGKKGSRFNSIFLTGNSHALTIKPYLDWMGHKNNFSFRTITNDSYPPIVGLDKDEVFENKNNFKNGYKSYLDLLAGTRKEIQRSKIIILHSSDWCTIPSMFKALENLIQEKNETQQIIILGTYPTLKDYEFMRKERDYVKRGRKVNVEIVLSDKDRSSILKLVNKYNNVYFFDLSNSKLFKNVPFYKDTTLYYDKYHINKYGSIELAKDEEKDFMLFFQPILNKAHRQNDLIIK
jgi:peptidoglycan/LPS O-acetylase OafA/YrhL